MKKIIISETGKKIVALLIGLFIALCIAEVVLRWMKVGATYTEQREGIFVNPAERMQKSWYAVRAPNSKVEMKSPEFCYPRNTNAEGLSDIEWKEQKDSNEIRIITLGDSYTEGDGAPFDSTYPKILEGLLQKQFPHIRINVMNAGRSGSDPWFEYKKLHDRLLKYHPDIIIYTNSGNDLSTDHLNYGGMERFASDSTTVNKIPKHSWLPLYGVSYVFRMIMNLIGYDATLFSEDDRKQNETTSIADARQVSRQYSDLAVKNNFICVQLIRPGKHEMKTGDYIFSFAELTKGTDTLPHFLNCDLLQYYKNLLYINQTNVNDYFWRVDNHHNSKGYAAMAQGMCVCLQQIVAEKVK